MELKIIEEALETYVYHIPSEEKVPLHLHEGQDEFFYCIKGEGFGVLEDGEMELTVGKVFIAPAGVMHSVRSDSEIYVAAFLAPVGRQTNELAGFPTLASSISTSRSWDLGR